jgi:hypothetical protein
LIFEINTWIASESKPLINIKRILVKLASNRNISDIWRIIVGQSGDVVHDLRLVSLPERSQIEQILKISVIIKGRSLENNLNA